jgi:acyl-[acyl carrier protein]--UDP-N-acetylglucosamine O-acyltransferase
VIGRGAVVGEPEAALLERANVELGQDVIIGRSATIGADVVVDGQVFIGYASGIGRQSSVGTGTLLGNLVDVADNVTLGEQSVLARGVTIATQADVLDSVVIGPDSGIGPTSSIGAVAGDSVRIRKGAIVGAGATPELDVRRGRDARIGADAIVRSGGSFRSSVRVGENATVSSDVHAGRASEICPSVTVPTNHSVAAGGFYPDGSGCIGELVVLDASRGGSGALDPSISGGAAYKQGLTDTGPSGLGANVTAVSTLSAATMNGSNAVILLMDGQVSNPVLSSAERAAVGQFVRDGGGLVVFFGYNGTDSIGSEFGFSMFHGPGNSGFGCWSPGDSAPTAAMPADIEFGPYGTVSAFTWSGNCHENIDLGSGTGMVALTSGVNASHDIAMIPPGALQSGSGPVITFMDYNSTYSAGTPASAQAASRNATAYAMDQ